MDIKTGGTDRQGAVIVNMGTHSQGDAVHGFRIRYNIRARAANCGTDFKIKRGAGNIIRGIAEENISAIRAIADINKCCPVAAFIGNNHDICLCTR